MKNSSKYKRMYYMPPECTYDWVKKDHITEPPIWCSVDLRDGNQALIEPMSLDEKLEYFQTLVDIGFKEIEVGFPAASETEYNFVRTLIEKDMVPDDVTLQVLTQSREHIIRKTFEAVEGAPHAIIHLYNSTSPAQREQVFRKNKEEVKQIAVDGAVLLRDLAEETEGNFSFQYSPESYSSTEMDYAVEVCNAVLDVWKPTPDHKVVINLPVTVEYALPHVVATQVEYTSRHLKYRDSVTLCLHPHNDRGTAIAVSELGMLAGAQRIEGTLFGNGERTGNVDIVTLALNMYMQGVDPGLDFSNLPEIREMYERCTRMKVYDRQPYAGNLVFTAFSGSHQDAIAKGMECRKTDPDPTWKVPYLPIDPKDLGRTYDADVIRINSQSGKGGVGYILKENFGISLPDQMREDVGYTVKGVSDREHKELSPDLVYEIFENKYINQTPYFQVEECHFRQVNGIMAETFITHGGKTTQVNANGNGRLDAVSNAIKQYFGITYELSVYEEHALSRGSSSKAMAYVGIRSSGSMYWGAGTDDDIIKASIHALTVAVNQLDEVKNDTDAADERMMEIMNYIQTNYLTVTLEELSEQFHLSEPYLSKYIKEKSGKTFGENLQNIRMKRAKSLLKNSSMTVENIAYAVGYQNVEHFNRTFKKKFGMTPVQFRNSAQAPKKPENESLDE